MALFCSGNGVIYPILLDIWIFGGNWRVTDPACKHITTQALPAAGPKLEAAIGQALSHLETTTVSPDRGRSLEYLKLWKEILLQSHKRCEIGVAPNLLKGDLASTTAINLTGRYWISFEKWFQRNIGPELQLISGKSGIPALEAVRIADRRGGYPDQSEAIVFLTFLEGPVRQSSFGGSQKTLSSSEQQSNTGEAALAQAELKELDVYAGAASLVEQSTPNATNEFLSPGNDKIGSRWRFGLSMVLLGMFLLAFSVYLLPEEDRSIFSIFSIVLFVAGLWDMDRANRGFER